LKGALGSASKKKKQGGKVWNSKALKSKVKKLGKKHYG